MKIIIEFDGGTSCNIPRLGYGKGYGSYKIDSEPVYQIRFNQAMSANAAEIRTLVHAIETIRQRGLGEGVALIIKGDSRIALKLAARCHSMRGRATERLKGKSSEEFREAIYMLN